jgi:hypothetical protein
MRRVTLHSKVIGRCVLYTVRIVLNIQYVLKGKWAVTDSVLLKLQRLQNKVLRTIGNFPQRTPVRDLHTAIM